MRAASVNLLLLCALAGLFYGWSALEGSLERHRRGAPPPGGGSAHRALPADPSAKTFRALLAVPRPGAGLGARNLTGPAPPAGPRDYGDGGPVEDGVFWSGWLEDLLPAGFREEHARAWQARARAQRIVRLDPGCGRISNRLATFADGSRACVRYGINADQVQGEALTYHLAGLLGITNLPPLALSRVDADSAQWAAVRARIGGLQWGERPVVSLTEWVSNLTGVVAPAPLRPGGGGLQPALRELRNRSAAELRELLQWSDLVALDFLTANFDRLASNLFSLQWDARAMERDTHNLLRTPRGDLVFVDNEAGLVHGFRVLSMWEKYHSAVLGSVCVFRRRTARRVEELHRRGDAGRRLLELYRAREPLSAELGFLSDEHAAVLQDRIGRFHRHVLRCREKHGGP